MSLPFAYAVDDLGPMKVGRPNRDVRFSHDKSPYKTRVEATGGQTV